MAECRQKFEQDMEQMKLEDEPLEKIAFDRSVSHPEIAAEKPKIIRFQTRIGTTPTGHL